MQFKILQGGNAALTRDGIVTTKVMTFDAVCKFADTATVITEGINVAATEVTAEQTSTTATYAFAMKIYREWG